jgi:transmembrane sensor
MHPQEDKISELLLDNRFVDWVVNPQSPYSEYWLQWVNSSAENRELAEQARIFLLDLRKAETSSDEEINEDITEQMLMNIRDAIQEDAAPVIHEKKKLRYWYQAVAAVLVPALVIAGVTFFKQEKPPLAIKETAGDVQQTLPEVVRFNGSEKNELVFLPDGSKVTLSKGARIVYNRLMSGKKRAVTLSGEAFFDVAKNPEKPFYIQTRNMVIKVLGTSFRVKSFENEESVIVRTGKVSVYLKEQDLEESAARILLPKQVCTYSFANKELTTSTYSSLAKIEIGVEAGSKYNFEEAPLDNVLEALEKMYDLPLHYDKEVFKNCFVTISLENESLEDKLEVLTKTVGASFSISDYGISIKGKGCD